MNIEFWKTCSKVVKISEPFVRVLRMVDSEDTPAMGFLHDSIIKVKDAVSNVFNRRKRDYEPYMKIINSRLDKHFKKNIHIMGYWLNPAIQYSEDMSKDPRIHSCVLDIIENVAGYNQTLQDKFMKEKQTFQEALDSIIITYMHVIYLVEWWRNFVCATPNLQKLAIRILSQTCSSSGCERNCGVFEHIHSKKRNILEHQRLNDLVYVHYNLRLKTRNMTKKTFYDPIDFDVIDLTEDLVVDDDPDQINVDELEAIASDLCCLTDEDNGTAAGAWNELDGNDDMELGNDRMFELHDLIDVSYQDVGFEDNHFNLNDPPR
ncbi:uncharacterized protein LOC113329733 [Papaver somniferum]|uniref:uncharacterized protein LOC113329733 n=1 Tax=Papaver somniferum TaxID=3469 RepID=UPI000E700204|nr:uncharacterized protein LOC113329733 [Papaver somniferum]